MAYIEHDFPIEGLNKITQKEGNAKKPIYQMHKWWARRLGIVFRMLIMAGSPRMTFGLANCSGASTPATN